MRRSSLKNLLLAGVGFVGSTGFVGGTPGTAIDTQAPLALHNPATSGKRVYLAQVGMGYVSGTPGAGTHWLCYNDTVGQAAPTGTSTTIKPLRMMSAATSSCSIFLNATLPNTPNVYIPLGPSDATGGGLKQLVYYCDGFQQIDPGGILSLQFVGGAGAAPVFCYGFIWVETDISGGGL